MENALNSVDVRKTEAHVPSSQVGKDEGRVVDLEGVRW